MKKSEREEFGRDGRADIGEDRDVMNKKFKKGEDYIDSSMKSDRV
jgi:hypothetical protein